MQPFERWRNPDGRPIPPIASGALLGLAAFGGGSLVVFGLAHLRSAVPVGVADAMVGYGFFHPFARSNAGTTVAASDPVAGLLLPAGFAAGPLLAAGALQARVHVGNATPELETAASLGASVAGGYGLAALAVAATLELSDGLWLGSASGATAVDPASTTASATVLALALGALGGVAATRDRPWLAVGVAVPPLLALVVLIASVA